MFDIPVVLFLFKRKDTLPLILERIRAVAPTKIYLLADGPRNELEKKMTADVRSCVEGLIDWDCEVIKHYADKNIGVYENIGGGAKWVLNRESSAIFLEDDNLPEETFFNYCKEMLNLYADDSRVLWVCGTNYLGSYDPPVDESYMFTKHLLPCGWASWSHKFHKYYDGELELLSEHSIESIKHSYSNLGLYNQDIDVVLKTKRLLSMCKNAASWDRQMLFSLRVHGQFGISPVVNQIRNIGVDELSTHGGTTMKKTMTERFCEIKTFPLKFPLKHPQFILIDQKYERLIDNVIMYPLHTRVLVRAFRIVKPLLGLKRDESIVLKLRAWKKRLMANKKIFK